jgi:hypothetical protein
MEKVEQETESFIGILMVVSHAHRSFQVPLDRASCRNCSTSEYRFVVVNELRGRKWERAVTGSY